MQTQCRIGDTWAPQCHPLPPFIIWTALINVMNIPEPKNLSNAKSLEHDDEHLKNILETLGEWDKNNINLVKRLGPFNEQSDRPRSLIVKFSKEMLDKSI